MKRCPNCGAEYEEDKKFCKKCGSLLSDAEQMSESASGQMRKREVSEEKQLSGKEADGIQNGRKRKKNVWMVLLVLLAIVIFCGGIFAVYMFQEKRLEEVRQEQARREREIEEEREEEEKARKQAEKKEKEKKEKEEEAQKQKEEEQKQKEEELKEQLQKKEEELQKAQEAAEKEKNTPATNSGNASSSGMSAGAWWDSKLASAEASDAQIASGVSSGASFEAQMQIAQSRYDLWDHLLNEIWAELEAVLPSTELDSLTDEQVSWIQQKEAMLSSYWQGTAVDHSGFPNGPAADLTRERVYYLRGRLPY